MKKRQVRPVISLKNVDVRYRRRLSFFRHRYIPALMNISFDIHHGETLGIIGPNGCGKSTLLKVISGIFDPDAGVVERFCSKVSLQTLSAGFDPDLSGRDNILLSSMLLGFSKQETLLRIDEMVDFSELGHFIELPIKTYSTGMRARLGFSVALTMQTDVLLVDEVLSVGDASFRKKAESAMIQKIESDHTVVLVSHSTHQIRRLCNRVIWLENGYIKAIGGTNDMLVEYEKQFNR